MGQYCFAGCRLSSSSVVVCNAAGGPAVCQECGNATGGRAGQPPGTWTVVALAVGRVGGRHCTAGQSCYVPLERHLVKSDFASSLRNM